MKFTHKAGQNLAIVAAVGAVLTLGWSDPQAVAGKGVALQPAHLRVPNLVEGEQRRVEFSAVNPNAEPCEVRVTTSCSCSSPVRTSLVIPAGGQMAVPIVIDTRISPGDNTARIQLFAKTGGLVAESLLTFSSNPEVVVEPGFLDVRSATDLVSAEVMSVATRRLAGVRAHCDDPALLVQVTKVNAYRWRLDVRRTERQRPDSGATDVVLYEAGTERELRRVPVHCANLPEARVRTARTASVGADGTRHLWVLMETTGSGPLTVGDVACGGQTLAQRSEPAGARARWVELTYEAEHSGGRATLCYATAGVARTLTLELP